MTVRETDASAVECLATAGLPAGDVRDWLQAEPGETTDFPADRRKFSAYWQKASRLLGRLPHKPRRNAVEHAAARTIQERAREARVRFLRRHGDAVYDALTVRRSRFVRVEDLVIRAAGVVPGLVPTAQEIAAEEGSIQRDKSGLEIDQGLFLSAVLGSARSGRHLCHAMLLPRPDAAALLPQFERDGVVELAGASVRRVGKAAVVTQNNPRFLNAEDQTSLDGAEICVDLALLDRATEIAVMRGAVVEHPKYQGRRVFGAGINLTHLYHGRIPFVWYLQRDLGYVNKIYRGLAFPDGPPPDEFGGETIEKPWIAAVEAFAIGGHCQVLLVMDYVLADRTAFLTLPARKEGIIPGAANMRLPRFTGDRIARQAIQYERRLECDSPEGQLICDELVETGEMDTAIERVVQGLTSSGVVSAAGNRRAFRVTEEPFDTFRSYFAVYAREQAYCHFSPALISNLERYWNAQTRKP
ncbi:MAG TPA: enoyl-CoA hydratase/isomerase family protein [Xanthobacteraceae bacterium]|nr:enoyl-CoA hydratase/isomerase family protein [Xanthobacteraceae bacterium]